MAMADIKVDKSKANSGWDVQAVVGGTIVTLNDPDYNYSSEATATTAKEGIEAIISTTT